MPVPAIDLIKKLMAKAGVTHDGELTADIPDEVATALDNQLLTIAAATNNHPDVKKVYFAQAYDGLDAGLAQVVKELGISPEVWADVEKAGGSTKRAIALIKKVKELSEKEQPADKTKSAELQAEIHKLHGQLKQEIEKQDDLKTNYDSQIKQIKIQTKLSGMLGQYKTVYDEHDPIVRNAAIGALITKALQDSDADFTFDDKGNLSLMKKDGTNLFGDNHTLVTPQTLIERSLSKILKVTGKPGDTPPAKPLPGAERNQPNTALQAALAENLAAYEAAQKQSIAV